MLFRGLFGGANVVHYVNRKIRKILYDSSLRILLSDPVEVRTQDPAALWLLL